MSSLSADRAEPALTPGEATRAVRALAMIPLLAYAALTQLDAVGNQLSARLPIGTTELILAGLIGTTVLLFLVPGRVATPASNTGARLIAAMFCWAVFSWTMSRHNAEGLDYLKKLATALLPAFCLLAIVDTPARLRQIVWAIIAAGAVSAAIVLIESRTGTRIVSTALAATSAGFEGVARSAGGSDQNPTTAAQMLLVSVLLAGGLLFAGERNGRLILAGVLAIGVVALVLASARSALIGFVAGAGLIALSFRRERFFPLMVIGGIVAVVGAIPFLPATLVDRFTAIGDFGIDPTLYRRISYLRIGGDLIEKSPIWGVGPGNYPLYYVTDAYRWMPGRELFPRELHNTYLDAATEYGLVGFGLFAAALGHALHSAWRAAQAKTLELGRLGMAAGVALAGLMVACFFMPHKDLRYLWLLVAIAIQCGRLRAIEERPA
jgi:O-antigen ligase